jgi:hypothetical protein
MTAIQACWHADKVARGTVNRVRECSFIMDIHVYSPI